MTYSTITKKGQTTVPKKIREHLKIKENQLVTYEAKEGYVIMRPATTSVAQLAGILQTSKKNKTSKKKAITSYLSELDKGTQK